MQRLRSPFLQTARSIPHLSMFVKILDALLLVFNMLAFKSKMGLRDTLGWTCITALLSSVIKVK